LAPDGFGLWLDAGDPAEDDDRTVKNPEGALDFSGEVHVSGGVDDVDALFLFVEKFDHVFLVVLPPLGGDGCGSDGDSALTLLFHPVGGRGTVVHFTDFMNHPGVEKNPLGESGLPCVDMRSDPDIAGPLKRIRTIWMVGVQNFKI
jgi:hypothetical protein